MNNVCLMGRLTADPELKQTTNGTPVLSFTTAVNRGFKNPDGTYTADFINCVAWRQTAEFIARYFKKGQMIGLNGSIQTRQYQDKDTGKNRVAFEVIINNAYFAESAKTSAQPPAQQPPARQPAPAAAPQRQHHRYGNPTITPEQQSFTPPPAPRWDTMPQGFAPLTDDGDLPF